MRVKIKSNIGFISANINKPKKETKEMIIFCPGFLDSKDYFSFNYFGKELSKKGFLTVAFDPTGTWGSSGTIKDYNFTNYLNDISSVIKYVKEKYSNVKKIILIGHSRGATISIIYSQKFSDIDLVIAIQPPFEVLDKWKDKEFRISKRDDPFEKNKFFEFNVSKSFLKDSKKYDVLKLVKNSKVPIYFIAGEFDDVVKPSIVRKIFINTTGPKEFFLLKVGHDFRKSGKENKIVFKKIKEILEKN